MPGKARRARTHAVRVDPDQVFLNVPYNRSYERTLVALTASLVVLRRVPRLTFQIPDRGQGRLRRIFDLLKSCRVSIHDLSAVGQPVRFNMPFELGLACAIKEQSDRQDFLVLEKKPHRLHKHLSDNGEDFGSVGCGLLTHLQFLQYRWQAMIPFVRFFLKDQPVFARFEGW